MVHSLTGPGAISAIRAPWARLSSPTAWERGRTDTRNLAVKHALLPMREDRHGQPSHGTEAPVWPCKPKAAFAEFYRASHIEF